MRGLSRYSVRVLWMCAAVVWIAVGISSRDSDARVSGANAAVPAIGAATAAEELSPRGDSAARYLVDRNPFRLNRQPSIVAFRAGVRAVATAPPRQPPPIVRAIAGGPPWVAILEQIPGRDGSFLVRDGDAIGSIKVRAIKRDTVVIQGSDTTWRLPIRRGSS